MYLSFAVEDDIAGDEDVKGITAGDAKSLMSGGGRAWSS